MRKSKKQKDETNKNVKSPRAGLLSNPYLNLTNQSILVDGAYNYFVSIRQYKLSKLISHITHDGLLNWDSLILKASKCIIPNFDFAFSFSFRIKSSPFNFFRYKFHHSILLLLFFFLSSLRTDVVMEPWDPSLKAIIIFLIIHT